MMKRSLAAAFGCLLLTTHPAFAQAAPESEAAEIVVEARRSGAPMWEVTRGDATILLVGEISEVPKATPWEPVRLEAATRRAKTVVVDAKASWGPGLIFKLLFKGGKLVKLPKGKVANDYLTPDQQRRLAALEVSYGKSYARQSFFLTARELLTRRLDYDKEASSDVAKIVRRTATSANIPVRPVGTVIVSQLIDGLLVSKPEDHVLCLDTAMAAIEAGPEIIQARGDAWTRFDIPAVMASPLEVALNSCWPWTDPRYGPQFRKQWTDELAASFQRRGVTMMVAPLRVLAEPDGLLDRIKAQGDTIRGPAWRAGAGPTPIAATR